MGEQQPWCYVSTLLASSLILTNTLSYSLDQINLLPASEFTPPPTPTWPPVESTTTLAYIFPWSTSCYPTQTNRPLGSCVRYGEQIGNPSFEDCSQEQSFQFPNLDNQTEYDLVTTQNGFSIEEAHTGLQSFKVVINIPGNYFGIQFEGFTACQERSFKFSYWSKQLSAGACEIAQLWGGVEFGRYQIGTDWGQVEQTLVDFKTDEMSEQYFELRVICANSSGLDTAVFIDDVSVVQVK
jgi:hypothetical protein